MAVPAGSPRSGLASCMTALRRLCTKSPDRPQPTFPASQKSSRNHTMQWLKRAFGWGSQVRVGPACTPLLRSLHCSGAYQQQQRSVARCSRNPRCCSAPWLQEEEVPPPEEQCTSSGGQGAQRRRQQQGKASPPGPPLLQDATDGGGGIQVRCVSAWLAHSKAPPAADTPPCCRCCLHGCAGQSELSAQPPRVTCSPRPNPGRHTSIASTPPNRAWIGTSARCGRTATATAPTTS